MDRATQDRAELEEILSKGRQHLRRARIAVIVVVAVLVAHFEYILFSCVKPAAGFTAILIIGYPVLLGALAISALWGGGGGARGPSQVIQPGRF